MSSLFDNIPLIQDDDAIHRFDGGETMGYDDGGFALNQRLDCLLNIFFRFGIERTGGFIEHKDRSVRQNSSCDSYSLSFSPRQFDSTFSDQGFILFWQTTNKFMTMS